MQIGLWSTKLQKYEIYYRNMKYKSGPVLWGTPLGYVGAIFTLDVDSRQIRRNITRTFVQPLSATQRHMRPWNQAHASRRERPILAPFTAIRHRFAIYPLL